MATAGDQEIFKATAGPSSDPYETDWESGSELIDLTRTRDYPQLGHARDEKDPFRQPSGDELDESQAHSKEGYLSPNKATNSPTRESLSEKVLRKSSSIALRRAAKTKYRHFRKSDKYYCRICDVYCNSSASRKEHLSGGKHKRTAFLASQAPHSCSTCDVSVRTSSEFDRHLSSKNHKKNLRKSTKSLSN